MPDAIRHTRASVLARVEAEYRELDRAVRRLTPAGFRRPAFERVRRERWTVKDALAHVIAWKWFTALSLRGERRPPRFRGSDTAAVNARIYRAWHRRSAREVVAEHRAVHREVVAALRAVPEERIGGKPRSSQWPFDLVGHSTEHRVRHIEATLSRPGRAARPSSDPTSSTRRRSAPRRPARPAARPATARRVRR